MTVRTLIRSMMLSTALACASIVHAAGSFELEEASIESIQEAIRSGATTCKQVVEGYIARARAYNGMCTKLVTADGGKVKAVKGAVRAGAPIKFPTDTLAIGKLVPDFANYKGLTPDFGRMEPTMSDPSVYQQYGMVVGIPNAQPGERAGDAEHSRRTLGHVQEASSTRRRARRCRPARPAACEEFRQQPDARGTRRAARREVRPESRSQGHAAVLRADVLQGDLRRQGHALHGRRRRELRDGRAAEGFHAGRSRLRGAGAIIYAQAHNAEYNGGSGNPGGDAKVEHPYIGAGGARETWGGTTAIPTTPTRDDRRLERRLGRVAVAANLVVCSICETTGGSCRSPATINGVSTWCRPRA